MNEQKLVKLLEEHFPTKQEFGTLKNDFNGLKEQFAVLQKDVNNGFKEVNEKLDELKSSSNSLDRILEQHPIPRIERLEQHAKLPVFVFEEAEE